MRVFWQENVVQQLWHDDDASIAQKSIEQLERFWPGLGSTVDMTQVARWNEVVPFTKPGCFVLQRDLKRCLDAPAEYSSQAISSPLAGRTRWSFTAILLRASWFGPSQIESSD